jgi:uncharacterized protein YbjT (DUF2867 family)
MTASSAAAQLATVFGGTRFLGRRVVRRLREAGFAVRIAARHPERGRSLFADDDPGIASIRADINEESTVAAAIAGSNAVVNVVSLYVERGKDTFRSVHVEAAARVARLAAEAGVQRLVHVSGIGADAGSPSAYIRSRGAGEAAVLRTFAAATLIRPAVMFGPDDGFVAPLLSMLRRLPAIPLFGSGATRLQPVYVEDIGDAVARIMRLPATDLRAGRATGLRLSLAAARAWRKSRQGAAAAAGAFCVMEGHRNRRRIAAVPADHAKRKGI